MIFRGKHRRQQRRYLNTQIFRNKVLDMSQSISTVHLMIFVLLVFFLLGFCGMIFGRRKYVEGFWYLKEENLLIFMKNQSGRMFHYICKERSILYFVLLCVGLMRSTRYITWGIIGFFGCMLGVFASELFIAFGNSGLFVGMLMVFPYMICYILGGGMILKDYVEDWSLECKKESRPRKIFRLIVIYLLFCLGMVIECYYFPWILKTIYVAFLK